MRARVLSARGALGLIVVLGAALQALLARALPTPSYFPDEYIYAQLGRSLATTGHLRVAGVSAHFPALMQPLLTAPLWLLGGTETAYRAIQAENIVAMSLAALPAFAIGRRLRLSTGVSLAVAGLAVAGPQLAFAGMILSEPLAYPLVLATVATTLRAVEHPSRRTQAALLVLCGSVALTRVQLAIVPICVAAAIVATGARERRLRQAMREQRLFLGLLALGGVLVGALVLGRGFGYYSALAHVAGPTALVHTLGAEVFVVFVATGVAVVPGALSGLAASFGKPRFRAEFAFGVLLTTLAASMLLESSLWEHFSRVQTRYLCYLFPLLGAAFALRQSRTQRRALPEFALAAALAAIAAAVPMNGWATASANSVSPGLAALDRLALSLHSPATAAGVFAIGVTVLAAAGAACARMRAGTAVALGLAIAASLLLCVLGASWASLQAKDTRGIYLPADAAWVDHALAGSQATMLVIGQPPEAPPLTTLFWNHSIASVVRAPGAKRIANVAIPEARIGADGTVDVNGAPLTGPVLVASDGVTSASFDAARELRRFGPNTLLSPRGPLRLASLMTGRLSDGRVLAHGGLTVWPRTGRLGGWIEVAVTVPRTVSRSRVTLRGPGGRTAETTLASGGAGILRIAACGAKPWRGSYTTSGAGVLAGHWVSALLSDPRYVADPGACS